MIYKKYLRNHKDNLFLNSWIQIKKFLSEISIFLNRLLMIKNWLKKLKYNSKVYIDSKINTIRKIYICFNIIQVLYVF